MARVLLTFPDLPLIVISGQDDQVVQERLRSVGLEREVWFLGKPFTPAELTGVVKTALSPS